ncbi:helix-turn-helix transcriptional regulator [Bauldia sp.]|uniref:helix-turn-helix transcriptional regulator n=1 Tax=Bauldia sp. TaxID=2575872 RepID=UPI003BA9ABA3
MPTTDRWIASSDFEETIADYFAEGLADNNARTARLLADRRRGFLVDTDVFGVEEMAAAPVYRDFFLPRGLGVGCATVADSPLGDRLIVHFEKRMVEGPFAPKFVEAMNIIRPHLARAALISSRFALSRVKTALAATEALGFAAALLGREGRVVAGNRLLDAFVPHVIEDRRERVAASRKDVDNALAAAVCDLGAPGYVPPSRSIPMPAEEGRPPMIIHLLPIHGDVLDVFSAVRALLIIVPVIANEPPAVEVIQETFELTPAEARVARRIGSGETIASAARALGIADDTARKQLKSVFAKSGVHRQSELVALLASLVLAPPRMPTTDTSYPHQKK